MKTYGDVKVKLDVFLTLTPDGVKWSASQFIRFNPHGKGPDIH